MSLTYQGALLMVILSIGKMFDVDIDEGNLTELLTGALFLVGAGATLYGRYRHGDITWYGAKE